MICVTELRYHLAHIRRVDVAKELEPFHIIESLATADALEACRDVPVFATRQNIFGKLVRERGLPQSRIKLGIGPRHAVFFFRPRCVSVATFHQEDFLPPAVMYTCRWMGIQTCKTISMSARF